MSEMIMPFLPVKSNGGPHDDDAYVAGYEMGQLDSVLSIMAAVIEPTGLSRTIHKENREQADLIAMRYGYTINYVECDDTWLGLQLSPDTKKLLGDESES